MASSSPDLPSYTSPTLALVNPSEEEKVLCWKLNGASWRGALSLPAYLRREEHLANQAFTRDGGITHWILVDTAVSIPDSSPRTILASCESLRKKALLATKDGKVEEIISHGIGSVFCRPEFRGRGYAGRMMKELGEKLEGWQQKEGSRTSFTVLYSDIGKTYYARNGWKPFLSSHIALPALASKNDTPSIKNAAMSSPLRAVDLPALCSLDHTLLRKKIALSPRSTRVALVPDVETMQWHHAREEFATKELFNRYPDIKGAISEGTEGERAWCIWTRTFGSTRETTTLHILRLVIEAEQDIGRQMPNGGTINGIDEKDMAAASAVAAVLLAAQREAGEWGMDHVELWNPSPVTVFAARKILPGAEITNRDEESIACLRWSGEGDGEGLEWVGNEKFGWC
ncbi:hypothetical protein MMC08_002616 [Hypocenomyce scalaris]|nr:hypothetical protein [Hypocenomyce scalaris]